MREIQIRKDDIRQARAVEMTPAPLPDGAARLALELFSLTANNVTYAAMGEGKLGYWDFFPGPEGWGRLPVWGFATVAESSAPGVQAGERYYGYYPMGEMLDVFPAKAGPHRFMDSAAHRRAKAPVYNQYLNTALDPAYDAAFEPEQAIFRPLYGTGWWAADCVMQGEPRPRSVLMSSASSKTALATAHQLRRLSDARLIALTSARNFAYVDNTGLYHETASYESVGMLQATAPAVYLDFLGRESLSAAVHHALGANLVRSILVGATDWGSKPGGVAPPLTAFAGPRPEFFFAPDHATARLKSDATLGAAMIRDLRDFYGASRRLVSAERLVGVHAVQDAWSRLVAGAVAPSAGLVATF
jgi:hypothetical protein